MLMLAPVEDDWTVLIVCCCPLECVDPFFVFLCCVGGLQQTQEDGDVLRFLPCG